MAALPLAPVRAAETPRELARRLWEDQPAIASSPLRLDRNDAWAWAPAAVAAVVLMPHYNHKRSLDERLAAGIDRDDGVYPKAMKAVTLGGDGGVLFGLALAGYGAGRWTNRPALESLSAHWLEALADASLWVIAIKLVAGRKRPEGDFRHSRFLGPVGYAHNLGGNSSFPSGHAALAFASAAVLSGEADDAPKVMLPAYGAAAVIGFSRIYAEKHWVSDVIVGAALGHSIGRLVENRRRPQGTHAWWEPEIGPDRVGAHWVCRF